MYVHIHSYTHMQAQETADMTQETSEGRTILQLIGTKTSIKILWLILEAYSFLEKCCIVSIIARMYVLTFRLIYTLPLTDPGEVLISKWIISKCKFEYYYE